MSSSRTDSPAARPGKIWARGAILLLLLAAIAVTAYLTFGMPDPPLPPVPQSAIGTPQSGVGRPSRDLPTPVRKAKTLDELLHMPASKLSEVDIAEMNLLCATGLPGAEKLDIDAALATLDRWAQLVKSETERHLYRATDPRYAEHYHRSEAYLRAVFLLQTLQEQLGVKYNLTAADNFSFADSRVAFIHGMIPGASQAAGETPGGTCASMPVLYVAIGRRLGYPLKLVPTKRHLFVRWDGLGHPNPKWRERFNIEGAGSGFSSFEDAYYTTWPCKLTEDEVRHHRYLVSMTSMEELACFLAARGHVGADNGQPAFAARCYENALRYSPRSPDYMDMFLVAATRSGYKPSTPGLNRRLLEHQQARAATMRAMSRRMPTAGPDLSVPPVPGIPVLPHGPQPKQQSPHQHAPNQPRQPANPTYTGNPLDRTPHPMRP